MPATDHTNGMAYVFMIIGYGWALLGIANIFMMFPLEHGATVAVFGAIFNVILFLLPGYMIGAKAQDRIDGGN